MTGQVKAKKEIIMEPYVTEKTLEAKTQIWLGKIAFQSASDAA